MRPYNGFEPRLSGGARTQLPAGGYVARVRSASIENTQYGERLVIEFDIAEGEYTGFYQADFDKSANSQYGNKWRGVYRANVPDDSGTEDDNIRKNVMNNVIAAFQASNPSYQWNWNENTLRGLVVGILMRDREWEMNGRTGWTTECSRLTDSEIIRRGEFETPEPRPLKRNASPRNEAQNYSAAWDAPPTPTDADAPPPRSR